jgi:hypothetical protein
VTTPRTLLRLGGIGATEKAGRAIVAGLRAGVPEAFEALVNVAAHFYASGGTWGASEWSTLTREERAACVEAAERVEQRRARFAATRNALAASNPATLAEMAAEFDGGALREECAVQAAMDRVEARALATVRSGG